MDLTYKAKRTAAAAARAVAQEMKSEFMEIPKSAKAQIIPQKEQSKDTKVKSSSSILFTPSLKGFNVVEQAKTDILGSTQSVSEQIGIPKGENSEKITVKGEAKNFTNSVVSQLTGSPSPVVEAMTQKSASKTPQQIEDEMEKYRKDREARKDQWEKQQIELMKKIEQKSVVQPGGPILPSSGPKAPGQQGKAVGIESFNRGKKN